MMITTIIKLGIKRNPQELFYLLGNSDYFCFLDSSLRSDCYSKFSYMGLNPKFILKSQGYENYFIDLKNKETFLINMHPLEFLNINLKKYINFDFRNHALPDNIFYFDENHQAIQKKIINDKFVFPDFKGGFIGYFSYDLKNFIETLPQKASPDLPLPLIYLIYFDQVLAYSHIGNFWYLIKIFENESGLLKNDFEKMKAATVDNKNNFLIFLKKVEDENCHSKKIGSEPENKKNDLYANNYFMNKIVEKYLKKDIKKINLKSNFAKNKYIETIKKAKKFIHEGEVYQINMTQRFKCTLPVESRDLYYVLRLKNPAPFSAYINLPEIKIGCSSPERFLYINKSYIETRPIKGTRPTGKNEIEDQYIIDELKNSTKDRAELNMIVDLERNDLGKFCNYGSVKVIAHAEIEKYAKVFHLVSTITGQIKRNTEFIEILKATFPGGSITGAPKIRAMQLIDELEPVSRNIYTGSLGYISTDGTVDLNIVIRSFIISGNKFYYNAGGGIVEDSRPVDEYFETLDKGKALEETLNFFKQENLNKFYK